MKVLKGNQIFKNYRHRLAGQPHPACDPVHPSATASVSVYDKMLSLFGKVNKHCKRRQVKCPTSAAGAAGLQKTAILLTK